MHSYVVIVELKMPEEDSTLRLVWIGDIGWNGMVCDGMTLCSIVWILNKRMEWDGT